jgi:hypothetical protein
VIRPLEPVLAHQGGWDEILLVAAPLSLFAGLLYLANRRADRLVQTRQQHDPPGDDDAADGEG